MALVPEVHLLHRYGPSDVALCAQQMLQFCLPAWCSCMSAICSVAQETWCRCVLCYTLCCCLVSVMCWSQDRLSAKHELLCRVESAQAELSAKLQAAEEQVQASDARLAQSQVGTGLRVAGMSKVDGLAFHCK